MSEKASASLPIDLDNKWSYMNETPNQPEIVFTALEALALPYHYRGAHHIPPNENFSIGNWKPRSEARMRGAGKLITSFHKFRRRRKKIWLLTNEKCDAGQSCLPLENYVEAHYTVIQEEKFLQRNRSSLEEKIK